MAKQNDPYPIDPEFEKILITMCCCKPKLWSAVGTEINPEYLTNDTSKLAMQAARSIASEGSKNGPESTVIVIQRLQQWRHDGRVTQEQIEDVYNLFEDARDIGLISIEAAIDSIKPVLQERYRDVIAREAITEMGKGGDMQHVSQMIDKMQRVGSTTNATGILIGDDMFKEIEKIRNLVRAPTGIMELDTELFGGSEIGSLFILGGATGDGKSMCLTQIAAEHLYNGMNVAYATLELAKSWTSARIVSNLSGVPVTALINGSMPEAQRKLDSLLPNLGKLRLEWFPSKHTTIDEIKDWVQRIEEADGITYDTIIIDYVDHIAVSDATTKGEYSDMKMIMIAYRTWMETTQRWGWTASQATRGKKGSRKLLGIDDFADSQNKPRIAHGAITLNVSEDKEEITFNICKNTNGAAGIVVGPLPTDWACARIVEIHRDIDNKKEKDLNKQEEIFN